MPPSRPKKPLDRRAVVEGARRAIQNPDPAIERHVEAYRRKLVETPPDSFADGVEAEKHLRENICPNGLNPYGPYVPPIGVSLHEKDDLVRFPPHLQAMFRAITPQMAIVLLVMLTKAVERQTVGLWWRRTYKIGIALVVAAFAAAKWGVDQVPLLRQLGDIIRGHLP